MREVVLDEFTSVPELADLLGVPVARLVGTGFHKLGLMLTIDDTLTFQRASSLAAEFGYTARRRPQ